MFGFRWTRGNTSWAILGISILMFLFGAIIGWAAHASSQKSDVLSSEIRQKIEMSLRAHSVFAGPEKVSVEFPPAKNTEFADFASRLARLEVLTSDLIQPGMTYLGGRLLPFEETAAAILMFRRDTDVISVIATRSNFDGSANQIDLPESELPYSIHSQKGYAVVLVGEVSKQLQFSLVRLVGPIRDQ